MRITNHILTLLLAITLLPIAAYAQNSSKKGLGAETEVSRTDSTKPILTADGDTLKRRFYSRLPYFTIGDEFVAPQPLDTTLDGKQYYEPGQQENNFRYRNLGNLGLAHIPLTIIPKQDVKFTLGLEQYDLYMFHRNNLRWYTLDQPFTNLFLLIGANREQSARVTHNQNIGKHFNFAFNFNRFASPGSYLAQETSHNNLALTSRYEAPSGKYGLSMMLLFNSVRVQDNGGSQGTDIFRDSSYTTSSLVAVELESAKTFMRDFQFVVRQEIRQGKIIGFQLDDTTKAQRFFADWVIYHELQIKNLKYAFADQNPNADYYGNFYVDADSLSFNVRQKQWGNRLGIQFAKILSADSSGAKYRNFLIDAHIEQQLIDVSNGNLSSAFSGLSANIRIGDHPLSDKRFTYEGTANYQLLGYNANDLYVSARMGYRSKKAGEINAVASLRNAEQNWLYNNLSFSGFTLQQNLAKTQTFRAGLEYTLPKYRLTLGGYFYNMSNYAYMDANRLPGQMDGSLQAIVFKLKHTLTFWDMGLENEIRVQFVSNDKVLPLPTYWGRNTLYYEKSLFKNNLNGRVGVDVFYNTNYNAFGYFPLTGQFHVQNAEALKFYPVMDLFVNVQVSELVIFLKMEHVNQGMFKENGYFNAYKYPAPPRAFKVGLIWRFYS